MINNNNSSSCDDDLCDPHCPDNSRTLGIIHEFRRLYEDKMRIIDNEGSGDCSLQAKICLQQDWIRDLNEQNEMLVRAVEELEQEATERVMALEDKLRQSSKYTSEVMNGYKDLTLAFQHVDAMEEDLGTLVDFIKRSFQLRMWNLHDLKQLRTVRIDDMEKFINGGSVSGSPPSSCLTSYYDQQMQHQLSKREMDVKVLQDKLEDCIRCREKMSEVPKECIKCMEVRQSMLDMRDALTAEVADKHDAIVTLKRDVQVLEEQCRKADQQTHFKDDIIKELRKEIKTLKLEREEKTNAKLRTAELENNELCLAIRKATQELEALEDRTEQYLCEKNELEICYNDNLQKVLQLEAEKIAQHQLLCEVQEECSKKIAEIECAFQQYRKSCKCEQQIQTQTLKNYCERSCNTEPEVTCTENKCVGDSMDCFQKACQTLEVSTRDVTTNDSLSSTKSETSPTCSCSKYDTVMSSLRAEEGKLEEVVQGLQSSVSKMMMSECRIKQDKARISELEQQLSCAWRSKECEVEAARKGREQEIANLKQLIETLIESLNNEKQRSQNLQKAVDLYRESMDAMKESEEKFKQEVLDQKTTIQNLQEALVQTKMNLEEVQQRSHSEQEEHGVVCDKFLDILRNAEVKIQNYVQQCDEFSLVIEKLLDDNVLLEELLFYNHQDLEMYEMRLAKYQKLYNKLESEHGSLKKEVKMLEAQRHEKDNFVQELSSNLSECREELSTLFAILNEEKLGKDDQAEQISTLQSQLDILSEKFSNALSCWEQEKNQNAKLTQSLMKNQAIIATIRNETKLAHEKLQEAAFKMSQDEQKIIAFNQQINDYQRTVNILQDEQEGLRKNLDQLQGDLQVKCCECAKITQDINNLEQKYSQETRNYNKTISELNIQVTSLDAKCRQTSNELKECLIKCVEHDKTERKIKQDLIDKETRFHTQINQFQNEQERLIAVVTNLEAQLGQMNGQLLEKERAIDVLKNNGEILREKHEENLRLRNEINTLLQTQSMLKLDVEKLQLQLAHVRSTLAANDEKHKLIIADLEACMNDLQGDKEVLLGKNDQLLVQLQSLQEMCNAKAENVAHLEMQLTDTKCVRDTLCNESRQVIDHVKCWLTEQRKINLELNQRIKHKNDVITKLRLEKRSLLGKIKMAKCPFYVPSTGEKSTSSAISFGRHQEYLHSPPPPEGQPNAGLWSLGSVDDSTACSVNGDSDWETDGRTTTDDQYPDLWIHQVETLTEELQRNNRYWKTKTYSDPDYSSSMVSRDK